jgi:hypothetical protein
VGGARFGSFQTFPQAEHWKVLILFVRLVNSNQRACGAKHLGQDGESGRFLSNVRSPYILTDC